MVSLIRKMSSLLVERLVLTVKWLVESDERESCRGGKLPGQLDFEIDEDKMVVFRKKNVGKHQEKTAKIRPLSITATG